MVLKKALANLKDRPRDERHAAALSIALLIVAILFVGWVILFFKKIQNTSIQTSSIGASVNSKFDLSAVQEAQQQLVNGYSNNANQNSEQSQGAQIVLPVQAGY